VESDPLLAADGGQNGTQIALYGARREPVEVKKQIGVFSAVFMIFNRIFGTASVKFNMIEFRLSLPPISQSFRYS